MEREYTVGAGIILITIVVIALTIYYTVPEFNEAIKQVADEVFGISIKQAEAAKKYEEKTEAISFLRNLAQAYEETYKGSVGCTYDADLDYFPEKYNIRLEESEGKKVLTLYEEQFIIERKTLPEITPCTMVKSDQKKDLLFAEIVYDSEIKIIHRGKKDTFLKNTPKFYKLDEKSVCFITDESRGSEAFFNTKKDCNTTELEQEKKAKEKFQNFIELYKKCKGHDGTEKCICGEVNLEEIPKPYYLQASQTGTETSLFLDQTSLKEVIKNNVLVKKVNLGRDRYYTTGKEKIEGRNKILYHGNKRDIYLSDPGDVRGWHLCFDVNEYLKFNPGISKEDYKKKLLAFAPKAEPYFEHIYSAAKTHNIDFFMVVTMIQQESNWNQKTVSWVGAAGLMQLMPDTARDLGLKVPEYKKAGKVYSCNSRLKDNCDYKKDERFNAEKNINAGVKYIRQLIGSLDKDKKLDPLFENILASYNAGLRNVQKHNGVPPFKETKDYVIKICGYYEKLNTKVCYV